MNKKHYYFIDHLFDAIEELLYPSEKTNPVEVIGKFLIKIPGVVLHDIGSLAEDVMLQGQLIFFPTSDEPQPKTVEFQFLDDEHAIVKGDGVNFTGPWHEAIEVVSGLLPGDQLMKLGPIKS
jgi:hypothetical protein